MAVGTERRSRRSYKRLNAVMDICQVAYFVPDARAAALQYHQRFGCGPFQVVPEIPLAWARLNGEPIDFVHTSAFGQWGDVMLELVQLDSELFSLFEQPGIHHVAIMVDSLTDAYAHFEGKGFEIALKAETLTGTEFGFVDAREQMGHLIELYEKSEGLVGFYEHIKAASESAPADQIFL